MVCLSATYTKLSHVILEHITCNYWEVTSLIVFGKTHSHTLRHDVSHQARQKQHHDARARFRQFAVGATVMVREGCDKSVWKPGTEKPVSAVT